MEKGTQERIIEIATELFATKGFGSISVRDITEIAQINVSSVSYYFI